MRKQLNSKCNDKITRLSWSKQVDAIEREFNYECSKSDRSYIRREKRDIENFYKSMSNYIDKDWWVCVSDDDKRLIITKWSENKKLYKDQYKVSSFAVQKPNIHDFFKWIKTFIKTDKAMYRDIRINKLLEELN